MPHFSPLTDGARAGMAGEGAQAASRVAKGQMPLKEAEMILGVESNANWEDVVKKYKHLYQANEKHGTFYLLSKVQRAKERIQEEYLAQGRPVVDDIDMSSANAPPNGDQHQDGGGGGSRDR